MRGVEFFEERKEMFLVKILRLHHAQWHIESELHIGTTITITIPQTGKE